MRWIALVGICLSATTIAALGEDNIVSVERGFQIAKDGTCHECHTVGYYRRSQRINPATAFRGSTEKYIGPWGTVYPNNIRLVVRGMTEDDFVRYASALVGLGPMTYFANYLRALSESDKRSLYQYVKSLGESGEKEPTATAPDGQPLTK